MISLLPVLLGFAAPPQPIYAALIDPPTAMVVQEDELLVAAGEELVRYRLDRAQIVQRQRVQVGPVRRMTGWDPVHLDTESGRWRWEPGLEPVLLPVSTGQPNKQVTMGKQVWSLDAKGALLRDGVPLAALGATDLLRIGHHGVLAFRRGTAATGTGDLVRFDAKGQQVWRSEVAPVPTAAAFDPKRSAIWVGNPSGGIDRWRIEDGRRLPAIPSGRSERIKCHTTRGNQVLVADVHGGLWLWQDRKLVFGKRFDGQIESLTLARGPSAVIRTQGKLIQWQRSADGTSTEIPAAVAGVCTPRLNPNPDDSLLHDNVRYIVRADGHWRSEATAGVQRGRTAPRRGR